MTYKLIFHYRSNYKFSEAAYFIEFNQQEYECEYFCAIKS